MKKCWWCGQEDRLSSRIALEERIDAGGVRRMTVQNVHVLVDDLWGGRAAMIRKLAQDYIELLTVFDETEKQ